jgi:hypothetical protein
MKWYGVERITQIGWLLKSANFTIPRMCNMLTFELVCSHMSDEQLDKLYTAVSKERGKRRVAMVPLMPLLSADERKYIREGNRPIVLAWVVTY